MQGVPTTNIYDQIESIPKNYAAGQKAATEIQASHMKSILDLDKQQSEKRKETFENLKKLEDVFSPIVMNMNDSEVKGFIDKITTVPAIKKTFEDAGLIQDGIPIVNLFKTPGGAIGTQFLTTITDSNRPTLPLEMQDLPNGAKVITEKTSSGLKFIDSRVTEKKDKAEIEKHRKKEIISTEEQRKRATTSAEVHSKKDKLTQSISLQKSIAEKRISLQNLGYSAPEIDKIINDAYKDVPGFAPIGEKPSVSLPRPKF